MATEKNGSEARKRAKKTEERRNIRRNRKRERQRREKKSIQVRWQQWRERGHKSPEPILCVPIMYVCVFVHV